MPAASPYRSTLTIDGTKVDSLSTIVSFRTDKDNAGMPKMGSLQSDIRCFIDFHDDQNVPYSALKKIFDMANVVTKDKVKDIKIVFWKDETHADALVSYAFKGWIGRFQTYNPSADQTDYNHLLVLELVPALDQQNFVDITISN